ncbi:hypothetical protein [Pedobacter ghigonis]|uniref:hypothetical protein n=1 Tax=Pedobacter ghigonis TaxID=2730403 RepID=UPI001588A33C|nr:hypothetical protein [Pedobacter ghigonis]
MSKFLSLTVLSTVLFFSYAFPTEGCLVGNTFYTSYLGLVRLSGNPEITGDKKVFNSGGTRYPINYSGIEVCSTVTANKYNNGSPYRDGPLCFAMPAATYNAYPASGTPGVRVASSYPSGTGSLQDFTISCVITPLPVDDEIWILIALSIIMAVVTIYKSGLKVRLTAE